MPIHDWTRVDAGLFHHFHVSWIATLSGSLNAGLLPSGYFALAEQVSGDIIPDVLTLEVAPQSKSRPDAPGGVSVTAALPKTRYVRRADVDIYAARANRIAIRHRHGQVVAVIEIVSPGNKSGRAALSAFVKKSVGLIMNGVHLLVIDLFPPTKRDPQGIHKAIWDEIQDEPLQSPPDKPLTLVSYSTGETTVAYVESVAVGDVLPDMPIFLKPDLYVPAPLEAMYQETWDRCPGVLKDAVLSDLTGGED